MIFVHGTILLLLTVLSSSAEENLPDLFRYPEEYLVHYRPHLPKCREESGVDQDTIEDFNRYGKNDQRSLKCYMMCILREMKWMNTSTGVFTFKDMLKILPQSLKKEMMKMGQSCMHIKGNENSDMCQLAWDVNKCWYDADPNHYQHI